MVFNTFLNFVHSQDALPKYLFFGLKLTLFEPQVPFLLDFQGGNRQHGSVESPSRGALGASVHAFRNGLEG